MKDPYSVLGLTKYDDPEDIKAKYEELHELYGEQRFKSGEEGNEGARKLQELEEAWALIKPDLERETASASFDGDYTKIDELIRRGDYNEAQDMLDAIQDRKGEWHYMQAIVFYKREWLSDAKTQLEMALRDEPNNQKYRSSLDKLTLAMGAAPQPQRQPYNGQAGQYGGPYNDMGGQPTSQPQDLGNCLSTCCCAYCLTDCLCNAMRCC